MANNASRDLKHRPETVWRLVEAHCKQITDALAAARVPLMLSLTWSFIWAWSLYSVSFGYIHTFTKETVDLIRMSKSADPKVASQFHKLCLAHHRRQLSDEKERQALTKLSEDQLNRCRDMLKDGLEWAKKLREESQVVSFPGGLGKITVTDLAVIGQLGLILILAWGYFSARREYQSVKAMVEIRVDPTASAGYAGGLLKWLSLDWGPKTFVLVPGERHLSAEHLAYAYHAVAQRFLLILTDEARPLPRKTIALVFFPAVIATINLGTDLYDLYRYHGELNPVAYNIVIAQAVLLAFFTWPLTIGITRRAIETAALLHGWHLAVREVWMDQWDERTEDPATPVYVDVRAAHADVHKVNDQERERCKLPPRAAWSPT